MPAPTWTKAPVRQTSHCWAPRGRRGTPARHNPEAPRRPGRQTPASGDRHRGRGGVPNMFGAHDHRYMPARRPNRSSRPRLVPAGDAHEGAGPGMHAETDRRRRRPPAVDPHLGIPKRHCSRSVTVDLSIRCRRPDHEPIRRQRLRSDVHSPRGGEKSVPPAVRGGGRRGRTVRITPRLRSRYTRTPTQTTRHATPGPSAARAKDSQPYPTPPTTGTVPWKTDEGMTSSQAGTATEDRTSSAPPGRAFTAF